MLSREAIGSDNLLSALNAFTPVCRAPNYLATFRPFEAAVFTSEAGSIACVDSTPHSPTPHRNPFARWLFRCIFRPLVSLEPVSVPRIPGTASRAETTPNSAATLICRLRPPIRSLRQGKRRMPPIRNITDIKLITPAQAAEFLAVSERTILSWIQRESVPFVELPNGGGRPSYRIPLQGLISSLSGNYDLEADFSALAAGAVESDEVDAPSDLEASRGARSRER